MQLTKDGLLSTALLEYEAVHRDLLILARLLGIVVYQPYKGLHGNLPQHSNVNYVSVIPASQHNNVNYVCE